MRRGRFLAGGERVFVARRPILLPLKPLVDSANCSSLWLIILFFFFFKCPNSGFFFVFPLSHFCLHVCFSSFVLCLKFSLRFSSSVSDLVTPPLLLLNGISSSPHSLCHALLCISENNIVSSSNVLPSMLVTDALGLAWPCAPTTASSWRTSWACAAASWVS